MQRRRFATDVLAQYIDLVGRHVQLVATLVRQQQVVALDAANRPLHHALELADAMLVMHDIAAGLQVFEGAGGVGAFAWPCGPVGASTPGEVALGDDGDLGIGDRGAPMQRRSDDCRARSGVCAKGEVETLVEQQLVEPLR